MKITSIKTSQYSNMPSNKTFKGSLNNKKLLKGLEFAAENGALVTTGVTLLLSTFVRPLAILMTPKSEKKDKQIASAKSIASSLVGFGLTAAIFNPVSKAMNKITDKPEQYLKPMTIKTLKNGSETLDKASAFNFVKQITKLSPEMISVLPKAILTTALITPFVKLLFNKTDKSDKQNVQKVDPKTSQVTFKGALKSDKLAKDVSKIINNKKVQDIALKYSDSNFLQHAMNIKDVFATACFTGITLLSSKIKDKDKKPLVYNSLISTGLSIAGGYAVNAAIDKPVQKFTEKFVEANKSDPKLYKYLNGIKIMKPILILSGVYYVLIPMLSTLGAAKLSQVKDNKQQHYAK
ncbi:MAG: hypothetical protein PHV37_09250 [Candidatus Gastranaerophilales bacterium]|nr:hypothetical protein [Candidatus Gastranaerophilales bacterium]